MVRAGSTVQLDGRRAAIRTGTPSYKWTQTGGPSDPLAPPRSNPPSPRRPAPTTLTFQLVVTEGNTSSPAVTITVTAAPAAPTWPSATATASSQNTHRTDRRKGDRRCDRRLSRRPHQGMGDRRRCAGSWLKLTWSSPQTINTVVLYDRPNTNDQVTGGTLTFSDGSTIAVRPSPTTAPPPPSRSRPRPSPASCSRSPQSAPPPKRRAGRDPGLQDGSGRQTPPIANAGPDQTVQVNSTVQLDGSASSDPGGNTPTTSGPRPAAPA